MRSRIRMRSRLLAKKREETQHISANIWWRQRRECAVHNKLVSYARICACAHTLHSLSLSHEVQTNRDKPKTTLQQRRRHPSQPLSIHHYPRIAIRDIQYKLFEPELQRHQHDHLLNGHYKKIITAKKKTKRHHHSDWIGSDRCEWMSRSLFVSQFVRPSIRFNYFEDRRNELMHSMASW